MFGRPKISAEETAAREELQAGRARKAYLKLAPLLEDRRRLNDPKTWRSAWVALADVSSALGMPELSARARDMAVNWSEPALLLEVGDRLRDHGMDGPSVTVLLRAYLLASEDAAVALAFALALQGMGEHAKACDVLKAHPATATSFWHRCALAFNLLLTRDLVGFRGACAGLSALNEDVPGEDPDCADAEWRLRALDRRARAVADLTPLDAGDLRGWTYVLGGSVLLHLSPFGGAEEMNGRYGLVQESSPELAAKLACLADVLALAPTPIAHVFALPDRDSEVLAHLAAAVLGCPLAPWPADGTSEPGLVAAYDLAKVEESVLATLARRHPAQWLWCHACDWTQAQPVAPELITFFHQFSLPPWGRCILFDVKTGTPGTRDPLPGSPAEVATTIRGQFPSGALPAAPPDLLAFARGTELFAPASVDPGPWSHWRRPNVLRASPVSSRAMLPGG